MRVLLKVLYWLAVLAISAALVIGLILWFESQDASELEDSARPGPSHQLRLTPERSRSARRANTITRCAAL